MENEHLGRALLEPGVNLIKPRSDVIAKGQKYIKGILYLNITGSLMCLAKATP
jgi:hypothetical protein